MSLPGPTRVTLLVAGGLLVLGALTFWSVHALQSWAMEGVEEEHGRRLERHIDSVVRKVAGEEFREGGDLARLAQRLVTAMENNPAILALTVVGTDGREVKSFNRGGGDGMPCVAMVPLDRSVEHVHAAGEFSKDPVACRVVPLVVGGKLRGTVLYHAERDWSAESERLGRWVERTALLVAPVFLAFYVLLGVLLIGANRAAQRWRRRAASAERVEALGAIADGINHEIKNPLNSVVLALQLLARKHDEPETRRVVEQATRDARRIGARLEEFVRFTRVLELETEPTALGEELRKRFAGSRVRIDGDAEARVDRAKMEGAFSDIVSFFEANGGSAAVALSEGAGRWRFQAEADVTGMDEQCAGRLFDPYVRARPHDVCCGLALARAVFQAHGGDLAASIKGTKLTLRGGGPKVPPGERRS